MITYLPFRQELQNDIILYIPSNDAKEPAIDHLDPRIKEKMGSPKITNINMGMIASFIFAFINLKEKSPMFSPR